MLNVGDLFGEVALLNQCNRTATVKSTNYCTMAQISSDAFFNLCNSFPNIYNSMRKKVIEYKDPWKSMKKLIL